MELPEIRRGLKLLRRQAAQPDAASRYAADPVGYCGDVLGVRLTPDQEQIARLLLTPPHKVLVKAGHNVGKSFLAACLVNWWFDSFKPGICLTTAPTDRQVRDILWKEIRVLRGQRGGFPGPKVCRLETSPDHWAHGFTARDGSRFQGHHARRVLIVFDESQGVDPMFWEAAAPMLGGDQYAMLAICNPTHPGSQPYFEERAGGWHVVSINCVEHPNIVAELSGSDAPYPSAIRLGRLRELINQWCVPLGLHEQPQPTDLEFDGRWWRPGPVAEARLLGRWPTRAVNSVWSDWAWERACKAILPDTGPLQIGCDVARFGDDWTAIHVRKGGVSLHHEAANGWSTVQTATRLKMLAIEWGRKYGIDPKRVPIAIDDAGVGGGVTDVGQAEGWAFIPVLGASAAPNPDEYPNMRSALWFGVAEEAALGNLSVARLSLQIRDAMHRELLAPVYTLDVRGRRVVEPKDYTKERLGHSPDNADAFNLAYARVETGGSRVAGRIQVPS